MLWKYQTNLKRFTTKTLYHTVNGWGIAAVPVIGLIFHLEWAAIPILAVISYEI